MNWLKGVGVVLGMVAVVVATWFGLAYVVVLAARLALE